MEKYVDFTKIPDRVKRIKIDVGLCYNVPQTQVWFENNSEEDLYVFGFEPNPYSVNTILDKNIKKRFESNGKPLEDKYICDEYFQLIPVALDDIEEPREIDFFCTENDWGCSSLNMPIDNRIGPVKETVKVPVFSLKHFFENFDWSRFPYIEYLKIDAQGSDFNIILSAGDYIKKIVYITAEPECFQYSNCSNNTYQNMKSYLESKNFVQVHHHNTEDPTFINKEFLHLADCIFIYQKG